MDYFLYCDGVLYVEDVFLIDIVVKVGIFFYVYFLVMLLCYFWLFDESLSGMLYLVCYVMKVLLNVVVLKLIG